MKDALKNTAAVLLSLSEDELFLSEFERAVGACVKALSASRKILLAGNGGSAADAQHVAAELVSRFAFDRPGLPAIALTTDTSILTAIGNDYGYERLFSRQIEALGQQGDLFIAYSTSGRSPNILLGLKEARSRGLLTLGLTGGHPDNPMDSLCDFLLKVPSTHTPQIQEGHLSIDHALCQAIESRLFGPKAH